MQTIRLSTTPGVVNPGAYLSQYDVGRQLLFLLYDDAGKYIPAAGSTVHIRATKPSGFGFDVACFWSQNSVTVTVTDEMSNESGSFGAELRIANGGDILGTANFLWNVERGPKQDGTIDGNAEAKNLMQAINAAITDAETAAVAANHAAATAGFSQDFKDALLNCFEHVAWINGSGQDYYDALEDALNPPVPATGITLSRSSIISTRLNVQEVLAASLQPPYATDTIMWSSTDTSVATVDEGGTVRIIGWGSATIIATAGNVSATCAVTATNVTLSSIDATFTQGAHVVYTDDTLDSLKPYLVVKAIFSDSSEVTLDPSDYTLSGTLTAGTSTITATYETKTDTFTVTVTQAVQHYTIVNNLTHTSNSNASTTMVDSGDSYSASIGVQTGYTLVSVTITMGGTDITSTAWNSGTQSISIASVTGNVVITAVAAATPASISAVFTPGDHVVYAEDTLDSLKPYLAVTATYSDSSTATIPSTDYTLSGSLAVGTSTITVTYMTKTDTFNVTVSDAPHWVSDVMTITKDNGIVQGKIGNAYPYHNETGSANRCTYCGLELDVPSDYKYTFNYTTTLTTTNIGVQCLNPAGVTAASNHSTMQDAQRNDYGWQSDGFVLYPKTWDKKAWFTFRRDSGSTAVTPDDFPSATVTRQKIDWVSNVMTLTNDWFIQGGLTNYAPKYNSSNNARVSYNGMAVDVEPGYNYTIHYTTTLQTSTNIGVQYLDESDLTKYAAAQNVETTDMLWQDDGYVFSMAANPTAKKLWFCFRAGDGSTNITPANFPTITITREAV